MRLKWGAGIRSPDQTRTTVWKPPFTDPRTWLFANFMQKRSFVLFCALLRSFVLFCRLAFALFCAHLRVSASVGTIKSLLMPLFLMGCFPVDFQDVKRPLRTKSVKRPIKAGKRPINEGKRPIKAKVLVGVSVGSLMGCFRAPPSWRKTAPLKRPIKRSMIPEMGTKALRGYRASNRGSKGSRKTPEALRG